MLLRFTKEMFLLFTKEMFLLFTKEMFLLFTKEMYLLSMKNLIHKFIFIFQTTTVVFLKSFQPHSIFVDLFECCRTTNMILIAAFT